MSHGATQSSTSPLRFVSKKKAPSAEVWMSLTVSLGFRDKAIKIIQYGSLILQWYYQHGSQETKAKILAARMGASMARKGFRMFRTLNHVCSIAQMIANWRALIGKELQEGRSLLSLVCREQTAIDVADFGENFFYGLYYFFDNILYFGRTKIMSHDDSLNSKRANMANFGADLSSFMASILRLRKCAREIRELEFKINQLKAPQPQSLLQERMAGEEDEKSKEDEGVDSSMCAYCGSANGSTTPPTSEESNDSNQSESESSPNMGTLTSPLVVNGATHTPTKSTESRSQFPFRTVASVAHSPASQKRSLFAPTPKTTTSSSSSYSSSSSTTPSTSDPNTASQLLDLEAKLVGLRNSHDKIVIEGIINALEVMVSANFEPMNMWAKLLGKGRFNDAHEGLCGVLSSLFIIYNLWPNRTT